ncbi:hypothetical protein C4J81_04420 [Deltaproteobacteria bacterium Smac51]|nr:hypothetical protein C4J81_04420 [Deltaproteobacteria bacterium Smac51]
MEENNPDDLQQIEQMQRMQEQLEQARQQQEQQAQQAQSDSSWLDFVPDFVPDFLVEGVSEVTSIAGELIDSVTEKASSLFSDDEPESPVTEVTEGGIDQTANAAAEITGQTDGGGIIEEIAQQAAVDTPVEAAGSGLDAAGEAASGVLETVSDVAEGVGEVVGAVISGIGDIFS